MNNFAVLTIDYTHTETEMIISVTTNMPVHLTIYDTKETPLRHKTSRRERGIDLPWGAYFCFVAWLPVEQLEAGDTLSHTFIIPNLRYCQVVYHAFRGTVSGKTSPSTSPIFSRHFIPWLTRDLPSLKDTYIWNFAHSAFEGNNPVMRVSYGLPSGTRTHSFIAFDSSLIPPGSTIISATLRLYYIANNAEDNIQFAYKLLYDNWVEMELNYHQYKAGSPWAVAGHFSSADYETLDPQPVTAIIPPFGDPFYVDWNVTPLLQDALDLNINLNLVLATQLPEEGGLTYRTKQNPLVVHRPNLAIVYHEH